MGICLTPWIKLNAQSFTRHTAVKHLFLSSEGPQMPAAPLQYLQVVEALLVQQFLM